MKNKKIYTPTKEFLEEMDIIKKLLGLHDEEIHSSLVDSMMKEEMIGREWIVDDIRRWIAFKKSSPVLVIQGKSGIGKTHLSVHLPFQLMEVGAVICCEKVFDRYVNVNTYIKKIAYALAQRYKEYHRWIVTVQREEYENQDLFQFFIENPLKKIWKKQKKGCVAIVIDDANFGDQKALLELINTKSKSCGKFLKFIVTKRSEEYSDVPFYDCDILNMDKQRYLGWNDIYRYIYYKIEDFIAEKDEDDWKQLIGRLAQNSGLSFVYAKLAAQMIRRDLVYFDFDLDTYCPPKNLSEVYKLMMEKAFNGERSQYYYSQWRDCLKLLLVSKRPVPIQFFKDRIPFIEYGFDAFCFHLSKLLRVDEKKIDLSMIKFVQWLYSRDAGKYQISWDNLNSFFDELQCSLYYTHYDINVLDGDTMLYLPNLLSSSWPSLQRKIYDKIIENEAFTDRLMAFGEEYYLKGDYSKAICYFRQAIRCDSFADVSTGESDLSNLYCRICIYLAQCYYALQEWENALSWIDSAIEEADFLAEIEAENEEFQNMYMQLIMTESMLFKAHKQYLNAIADIKKLEKFFKELSNEYPMNEKYKANYMKYRKERKQIVKEMLKHFLNVRSYRI